MFVGSPTAPSSRYVSGFNPSVSLEQGYSHGHPGDTLEAGAGRRRGGSAGRTLTAAGALTAWSEEEREHFVACMTSHGYTADKR